MDSPKSLWSDLPLTAGIATLVCYAGVFNDVIGVEEVASRLGVPGSSDFRSALSELQHQGRVILKDGFVGLPHLENQLAAKPEKIAAAHRLIESRRRSLWRLGRNPTVRFVGISGSLAAANPIKDRNNHLDLDVFVVTRHRCLWVYRILLGFRGLFSRFEPQLRLCVNYVMDAAHLEVLNRNLYTATEIKNLIPVSGFDMYADFLAANKWVNYYYPGLAGGAEVRVATPTGEAVNRSFFALYTVLRSIKWMDLSILREISFKTDPTRGGGMNATVPAYGGYQAMVQNKFGRLARTWFPELLDSELIDKLFPDQFSMKIRNGEVDVAALLMAAGSRIDYGKYG